MKKTTLFMVCLVTGLLTLGCQQKKENNPQEPAKEKFSTLTLKEKNFAAQLNDKNARIFNSFSTSQRRTAMDLQKQENPYSRAGRYCLQTVKIGPNEAVRIVHTAQR